MKKLTALLSFLVLFTAFTCDDEPLDDGISITDTTGGTANSGDLIGEWTLVSFDVDMTSQVVTPQMTVETNIIIESTDVDYNIIFNASDFTASGSYSYDTDISTNGQSFSDSYVMENVSGSGVYTVDGNQLTANGQFFEFTFDGVDDSMFNTDEQTVTFEITDNGNTLTFYQDDTQVDNSTGFETTISTVATSVWQRVANQQSNDLDGTWLLTAWNGEEPIDLNGDGTENINFLDEMDCYDNETMEFNTDGTGMSHSTSYADIFMELEVGTTDSYYFQVDCIDEVDDTNFTWTQSGNTITISVDDGLGGTEQMQWTLDGNELSITIPEGFYVSASDDATVTTIQDLTFVYTKQ